MCKIVGNKESLSIRDIQIISLDILKFVTDVCERQGFKYSLIYGTLLGAVRHKGFIPWDDDIDIMMPRPDYERFLKYAESHIDTFYPYEIFNRNLNKDYLYSITRVSDSRYIIAKDDEQNCGMGIFIDIYPYDGLGNDYINALYVLTQTKTTCNTMVDITRKKLKIDNRLNIKGKATYLLTHYFNKLKGIDYFIHNLEHNISNYTYESSEYIGPAMWFFANPEEVLFNKNLFNDLIKLRFEDGEFYAPAKFDEVLSQLYGDYLKLPPEEKRINQHHYRAYKKH